MTLEANPVKVESTTSTVVNVRSGLSPISGSKRTRGSFALNPISSPNIYLIQIVNYDVIVKKLPYH